MSYWFSLSVTRGDTTLGQVQGLEIPVGTSGVSADQTPFGYREGTPEMFDGAKVQTLLLMVFGLVIVVVGISLAAGSKKAQYSETARVSFNVIVAIVLVAIGLGALSFGAFGKQILSALGISAGQ